jgi:hypothetical protein
VLASSLLIGGFNGILFSYYSAAPYLFIDRYEMSSEYYGILGLFMAAGVCFGSLLSHRINHQISTLKLIKWACLANLLVMLVFFLLVSNHCINTVHSTTSVLLIMLCMMSFYICFGIAIPNVLSKALVKYQGNIGAAGSIFGLIYYLWVALFTFGIALFSPNSLFVMPAYFLVISLIMMISTALLANHE